MSHTIKYVNGSWGANPDITVMHIDRVEMSHNMATSDAMTDKNFIEVVGVLKDYEISEQSIFPCGKTLMLHDIQNVSYDLLNKLSKLPFVKMKVDVPVGDFANYYKVIPCNDNVEMVNYCVVGTFNEMPPAIIQSSTSILHLDESRYMFTLPEEALMMARIAGFNIRCTWLIPREKLLSLDSEFFSAG